jgi:threonine aldolase
MSTNKRGFASDNNAGVHPEIIRAMETVNFGHTIAYGDDSYTLEAKERFKQLFGNDIDVYFVFNGTAANVLGLTNITQPYNAVICPDTAHVNTDECGAPEKFTGCKLITIPTQRGKLTPELVLPHLQGFGFEHHVQPRVISISQATELGTIYTLSEIKALSELAHSKNMLLHIDGARIANAAAALAIPIGDFTKNAGVDVLSFGGTKNGMMFGEAIIFFNQELSENFKYIRKQGMQLYSKMRFIAAQFNRYLQDDFWLKTAAYSNHMAKILAESLSNIKEIKITQEVQVNGVFAIIPKKIIPLLQKEYFFYVWNENTSEVRWMCSWDTTEEDIKSFIEAIKRLVKY